MPVHNVEIARIFETLADLLDVQGDNPFSIRAYRNAAHDGRATADRESVLMPCALSRAGRLPVNGIPVPLSSGRR